MKLNVLRTEVLAIALAATAFGAIAANAQTTVIEERRDPSVTIQTETPATSSTTVKEERGGLLGTEKKSTTTTTGAGVSNDCTNKTVHKEGLTGDKTVSKTTCD
jgi:hypothetical protein